MGGISVWQLLIVLLIVLLLFGAKKLRSIGGDLGSAVKGFRGAMRDGEREDEEKVGASKTDPVKPNERIEDVEDGRVIDVDVAKKETSPPPKKDNV